MRIDSIVTLFAAAPSKVSRHLVRIGCVFLAMGVVPGRADGTKTSDFGELFQNANTPELTGIKPTEGVTTRLSESNGTKRIKVDFAKLEGYPGLSFPAPARGWDLSGFTGVQIEVTNPSATPITVNLKVENEGDWKTSPWSLDMITLKPGETKMLKATFGQTFKHPGFNLDPAHVTAVRLYIVPPKQPVSILIGSPMAFKDVVKIAPPATPEPEGPPALVAVDPVPKPEPVFPPTPQLDLTGKHDFPTLTTISDDVATQLKGLCSLKEFLALPEGNRHVYSFDVWPVDEESLGTKSYAFNFHLGKEGVTYQKVAFLPSGGGPGGGNLLTRVTDSATKQTTLTGFGNLSWSGKSTHVFKFDKPVIAFGVVLRSSADFELRKFFWKNAHELNGYPFSYTLVDGTVIQVGERELRGALVKAQTDAFIGVMDRSGHGIVSVTYSLTGLGGNVSQGLNMVDLAFITLPKPAVSPVIGLKSSCDFDHPEAMTASPILQGLSSLDEFRFIVANHRYVYDFGTWPQATPEIGSNTVDFSFDLKGKGEMGEKVTVTATDSAHIAKLTQETLKDETSQSRTVLGGLGDIGKGAWAEQTFRFDKPVWAFGVTYFSPADFKLARTGDGANYPVSYTLSDGTVVNLGASGVSGGTIFGDGKTYVGVMDKTDKGITSVTLRVEGTATGPQPISIGNLAFALAGPPPGEWKMTMHDEFDGDKLNPAYWATGYTFPDVINSEMQGYVPENVTVGHGVCTIKIEQRDCANTDRTGRLGGKQKFASGAFTSYDKFSQTYGYFEARIKMPKARGAGLWPAFWMLTDRGKDYPEHLRKTYRTTDYGMGSEIDIFEFQPSWKREDGTFPIHVGTIWSYGKVTPQDPAPHGYGAFALGNDGWGPQALYYPGADTEFHTYGLYWSPERLIYYVDSKPIFRVRDVRNVPDVPEYFLFNVAITGNGWGKTPGKKNPTPQMIAADMPNQMEIDYFRAYSGTLEEDVPTSPTDLPVVRRYAPPPPEAFAAPAPGPTAAPAATATPEAPAAPVNSTITSPSQ